MSKVVGIYLILNKENGKKYIGSSSNIEMRWIIHKYDLKNNKHHSKYLQRSWNKYKEESFEFSILKECKKEELKYWEEYYIELYESWKSEKGYNVERISNGVKVVSEETRKKLSEIGKKNNSGENHPQFGTHRTEETKQKLSDSHKGENCSNSKLTWEQIREIRVKYIPYKYTMKMLAEEYNVNFVTISNILRNETWKEMTVIEENFLRTKLTLEQIEEIKQKYIPYKYSSVKLAKEYGVSDKTVRNMLHKFLIKE